MEETNRMKCIIGILSKLVQIVVVSALTATWAWPLYGVGLVLWGRPPIVPRMEQIYYYSRYCLFCRHDQSIEKRIYIFLQIVFKVVCIPFGALAWYTDEILYGSKLDSVKVDAPLFVMSAGRSGSTQVTLYLEEDPNLVAPNISQSMAPFLWLWKLVPTTVGCFITKEMVRRKLQEIMPPEMLERHEGDPFKVNTFDGAFYSSHLNYLALAFNDPEFAKQEFGFAKLYTPLRKKCWEEDFVKLVDRLAKKTLLQHAQSHPNKSTDPPRFFLKGHFLAAGSALARRYPNARFLTVVREPSQRLQSAVNFLRINPADPVLGPTSWELLAKALEMTEMDYCEVEQQWFTKQEEEKDSTYIKVCAVPFSIFCNDLKRSMEFMYKKLDLADSVPSGIPAEHPRRDRKHYLVNKSLEELGIDGNEFSRKLDAYIKWCETLEMAMKDD
jgi:hypothetical protein